MTEIPVAKRFEKKVALVTGASDRGIGGAIAERLAREGASLALASRTPSGRLLKKLDKLQAPHHFAECDVTEAASIEQAIGQYIEKFGKIDVVVNNAGVEVARPFTEFTDDQWQSLLDVNLQGAVRVTRAVLPHFPKSGGAIVNIASALGLGGCAGFTIYSASKAGLIGLTQSLAWELAPQNIRVTAVAPGMVHTPMIHKHIQHLTKEVEARILAAHPLGMGMPHDVASAVAFLASDEARWITGVTLPLGWGPNYQLPVAQFLE